MNSVSRSGPAALDEDQRRDIARYISKDGKPVTRACLEKLLRDIEASIAAFQAQEPEASFRQAHDALRGLWSLTHKADADVPVGLLRIRIQSLPTKAVEYLDRRATLVSKQVFDHLDGRPALDEVDWRTKLPREDAEHIDRL
jgi:hypothetical protein